MIDDFDLNQLVEPLLHWFWQCKRSLPWRDEPTPYHVWVSEIMLQQTRVEAVKPYYERFMKELPDVAALAGCPEEKLLKLWEGLGYYNRVRNLNAAAIQVMEEFAGVIPDDYDTLLNLKGIGHYTAGAIASIAYQKPVPAVDGNVLRVISRVTADDADIMKQPVRSHMEECLAELLTGWQGKNKMQGMFRPGDFNQALMELGAIVCVPNGAPYCDKCPWNQLCEARRRGLIDKLPVKQKAKARKQVDLTVLIVRDGEKVAIHKRTQKGLLAGMYELPNLAGHWTPDEVLAYLKKSGYAPLRIQALEDAKHIFSHVEWNMKAYAVLIEEAESQTESKRGTENDSEKKSSSRQENAIGNDWIFIDSEDAGKRYAIPAAFSYYTKYMEWKLGRESFLQEHIEEH